MFSRFDADYECDRQTDRRTDNQTKWLYRIRRFCIAVKIKRGFHHYVNATHRKRFPVQRKRRDKKSVTQELAAAESLQSYKSASAGSMPAELRCVAVQCVALRYGSPTY